VSWILLVSVWGCSPEEGAPRALGSQSVASSEDGTALYGLDTDGGRVVRYDVATGVVAEIDVGAEPTRITRAGGTLFVTLRGERGLAELSDGPDGISVVRTAVIGTEPYGIVADERGDVLYVALSTENRVVELDADTFDELRSWSVAGEPRWLAITPDDRDLYVVSAFGGTLTHVDLRDGEAAAVEFPEVAAGDGVTLARRFTGDPGMSSDGSMLVAPGLYVDVTTPVITSEEVSSGSGYGSAPEVRTVSRLNAGLTYVPLDRRGEADVDRVAVRLAAGELADDGAQVRGYVTSAVVAPGDDLVIATMESSDAVLVAPSRALFVAEETRFDTTGQLAVMAVRSGPRGVAFTSRESYAVDSFLSRTVTTLRFDRTVQLLLTGETGASLVQEEVEWFDASLPVEVEAGRRLFYSSVDEGMAAPGSGVSCSTCHFEGRNDGLTWTLHGVGLRQTPSLAGQVSLTAPVTWTSAVPTVGEEAQITSGQRMGGIGIADAQVAYLEAFVDWTRHADHPGKGAADEAVERGRALFEREDVGCAECHVAPTYTSPDTFDLYGLDGVSAPSLLGVAVTAPYLHAGNAATLEDVLVTTDAAMMGDTSMLTESEKADLLVFLRSL
jgi:hypothetical protein